MWLQDHNPDHGLSWAWRSTTLRSLHAGCNPIDFGRQLNKINRSLNLSQWITQIINLLSTLVRGKKVIFDGTGFLYDTDPVLIGLVTIIRGTEAQVGIFEAPSS